MNEDDGDRINLWNSITFCRYNVGFEINKLKEEEEEEE